MPSQSYRGHVIDVTCFPLGGRIAYLSSISAGASGEIRHREASGPVSYDSDNAAQDRAFTAARSWVERFPLCWPFPACSRAAMNAGRERP
jgi:hypothetical protein